MGRLKTFILAGASLVVWQAAAAAADMPPMLPPPGDILSPIDRTLSGWYIRGDVGYRFQQVDGAVDLTVSYPNTSITDAFMGGGGGGYKWNWLRLDITGDYGGRSTLSGSSASGVQTFTADVETYSVMLNAYADLGTWWGITPYVGGGVGKARVATYSYQTVPAAAALVPPAHSWNNAWAAMAGFSYSLTDNILLDVGYRHIDMGKVPGGLAVSPTFIDSLTGDEIRIGLRYTID
jgi:opacity protein-like surface antigen